LYSSFTVITFIPQLQGCLLREHYGLGFTWISLFRPIRKKVRHVQLSLWLKGVCVCVVLTAGHRATRKWEWEFGVVVHVQWSAPCHLYGNTGLQLGCG
jgi:hypothetical protein